MNKHTAYERLRVAVEGLASSHDPLRVRLEHARVVILVFEPGVFTDHPDLDDRFTSIRRRLGVPALRTLSDDDLTTLARDIFTLFCDVADLSERQVTR